LHLLRLRGLGTRRCGGEANDTELLLQLKSLRRRIDASARLWAFGFIAAVAFAFGVLVGRYGLGSKPDQPDRFRR
jgi:hypothetical protein